MVPGQARSDGDRPQVLRRIDLKVLERFAPDAELDVLFPRIHARAFVVRALDHVAEPAITTRQNALEDAGLAVMRLQLQTAHLAHGVPEHLLLALRFWQ